jgi:SAM-dependent methyltransferase
VLVRRSLAMADDRALAAMFEYYERGEEQGRLDEPAGQLEFARTRQIIARYLPPPPATVADIGGGPGRYSLWLAALGYRVLHRDVVPLHVDQLRRQAAGNPRIDSAVADARDPGLDPGSADAVLLLGPLYHLDHRADRLNALAAAARVVRPGGPVFAAAISRWAARLDGVLRNRLYQSSPLADPAHRLRTHRAADPAVPRRVHRLHPPARSAPRRDHRQRPAGH